jgi:hypothetical protein
VILVLIGLLVIVRSGFEIPVGPFCVGDKFVFFASSVGGTTAIASEMVTEE